MPPKRNILPFPKQLTGNAASNIDPNKEGYYVNPSRNLHVISGPNAFSNLLAMMGAASPEIEPPLSRQETEKRAHIFNDKAEKLEHSRTLLAEDLQKDFPENAEYKKMTTVTEGCGVFHLDKKFYISTQDELLRSKQSRYITFEIATIEQTQIEDDQTQEINLSKGYFEVCVPMYRALQSQEVLQSDLGYKTTGIDSIDEFCKKEPYKAIFGKPTRNDIEEDIKMGVERSNFVLVEYYKMKGNYYHAVQDLQTNEPEKSKLKPKDKEDPEIASLLAKNAKFKYAYNFCKEFEELFPKLAKEIKDEQKSPNDTEVQKDADLNTQMGDCSLESGAQHALLDFEGVD